MKLSSFSFGMVLWLTLAFVSEAGAACQTSVSVPAGGLIEIGKIDNGTFDISKQPKFGSLTINTVASGSTLNYNAANTAGGDTAVCAISGQPPVTTAVTITAAQGVSPEIYSATARTLVLLFALAVVLESALGGLFRWRPFAEFFNPRAVRPLVAVALSWFFVIYYQLDIVTSLVNAGSIGRQWQANGVGQFITALVLAGGSAGINSIMVALGWRQVVTPETVRPKPDENKAWIAVRAIRKSEASKIGDIDVYIGTESTSADGRTVQPPYAGTIKGSSRSGLVAYFTRDEGRFPSYGGYEVNAGDEIKVLLSGRKADQSGSPPTIAWGPHRAAPRAIIDLDLEI